MTNGVVTGINITNVGSGYTTAPTVTIAPPPGLLFSSISTNYTSPAATGTISFVPANNSFGSAVITVTVMDNGGTAHGGVNLVQQSFTVTATQVATPPTIARPADITIPENTTTPTTVGFGISAGGNGTQIVTISASSSNPALIANPGSTTPGALAVNYSNGSPGGSLTFTPVANQSGTATITVTASDSGGSTPVTPFVVNVSSVNLRAHSFTVAPTTSFLETTTTRAQTVNLTAIRDPASNPTGQTLTITATSSNTALVSAPQVHYTSPNATGTLTYSILPAVSGTATISVTVSDSGSTANGGLVATTQSYTITVTPVNSAAHARPDQPRQSLDQREFRAADDPTDRHQPWAWRQCAGPGSLRHRLFRVLLRAVGQLHSRQHHRYADLHSGGPTPPHRRPAGGDRRLRDRQRRHLQWRREYVAFGGQPRPIDLGRDQPGQPGAHARPHQSQKLPDLIPVRDRDIDGHQ